MSAFWGYTLGRQALSGVTQPDTGRTGRSPDPDAVTPAADGSQEAGALQSEEEILTHVTALMKGEMVGQSQTDLQPEPNRPDPESAPASDPSSSLDNSDALLPSDSDTSAALVSNEQPFPVLTEHQQVTLTVNSVRQQGAVLRMGVSLKNTGDRPVEFLYSLMDVLDEQGQSLSVSTDGLPQQIPPTGETFQGAVIIPSVLLGSSNTLSLRLTDYPNQQVQLQINDIPISQ